MTTVSVASKPWYQSKTVWVNVLVGLLAVIGELQSILPESRTSSRSRPT